MNNNTALGLIVGAVVLSAASATIAAKIAAPHGPGVPARPVAAATSVAPIGAAPAATATSAASAAPSIAPASALASDAGANPNVVMVSTANRRMLVVNVTNHILTNLYASSVNDPNYHADWLGTHVLAPGESAVVNFEDGAGTCEMDVKGVFSDGGSATNTYNVCAETEVDFTGN